MAFKLRLQIFFLILTVVPLLVGGWMIQRTVVESRRSSIDQQLASGVGTLGTQYAGALTSGRRALTTLPGSLQLQRAIDEVLAALKNGGEKTIPPPPPTPKR